MSSLTENQNTFKTWIKEYSSALKLKEVLNNDKENSNGFYSFMVEFKNWLYSSIHNYLTPNKYDINYEKTIRIYCNYIRDKIIIICRKKIKYYRENHQIKDRLKFLNNWINLEDDFMALACYRDLKLTAIYLERGKSNKLWADTMPLFENFFDYSQKMVFGEKIKLIRASYFPGAGKTYAANILCAWWYGYDSEMSILRITYSEDLCKIFIQQIAAIIDSKQFRKIFPQFNVGEGIGNRDLYQTYSIELGFKFKFSSVNNFFASTRDGQTTGKRGKVLIIDDLTKGEKEAYDEKIHKSMQNRYDFEWTTRTDTSYQPVIALGTMWSNLDLLNVLRARANKFADIVPDEKYKYTEIAKRNGIIEGIFISTPMLDYETDETTCPQRYNTEDMREKRDVMDEFLWNAVYQQRPTPPSEFLFAYSNLLTYDDNSLPKELFNGTCETQCYAFLDPTRKGNDFLALGIFKRFRKNKSDDWSKWYLIDCIFEQEAQREMIYQIATKLINHKVSKLGIENNIDGSLADLLHNKLKELKSHYVEIEEIYSTDNKQVKIRMAAFGMKTEIVYPCAKMYSLNSPMGKAMQQLTSWAGNQKYGDHDDFPDMVAMFVKYFCEKEPTNTMEIIPLFNLKK